MNGSILAPIPDASPSIALTIYANGVVVFSGVIPNEKAFKLPAGYRAHAGLSVAGEHQRCAAWCWARR